MQRGQYPPHRPRPPSGRPGAPRRSQTIQIPAFIHLPGRALEAAPNPGLQGLGARPAARVRRWLPARRTLAALRALDDATRRDIGLSRWQLSASLAAARDQALRDAQVMRF